jgi:hypothetical protein
MCLAALPAETMLIAAAAAAAAAGSAVQLHH